MSGTNYIASNWRVPENSNSSKNDNYSLSYDGAEYITINSSTQLNETPLNPYSISFWIKTTNSSSSRVISEKRATSTFTDAQYTVHLQSGSVYWYGGAGGTGSPLFTSSPINDGEWHHIVLVAESTISSKMYVDGQLDGTSSGNRINSSSVAGTFNIGSNYTGSFLFIGDLSEYSIFDYALDSLQVSTLYGDATSGAGNPMALKPTPVAYYPLGDNSSGDPVTQPNASVDDASVFDFDGSTSYIDTGVSSLDGASAFTISTWVNSSYTNWMYLIGDNSFRIATKPSTTRVDLTFNGSVDFRSYSFTLNAGQWHHVVATFDGSLAQADRIKLYLDDVPISNSLSGTPDTTFVASGDFMIGRTGSYSLNEWNGYITQVATWNSVQNVTTLYNNGIPGDLTSLSPSAWYKLDQSANWEADTSGNWQVPDAVSAYPQSFSFNGTNQYVPIGTTSLGITSAITVSAWVKIPTTNTGGPAPNIQEFICEDATGGSNRNWGLFWRHLSVSNKNFYFLVWHTNGSSTTVQSTGIVPNDGNWHHIMGTFDGTTDANGLKLYVDGTLFQTTAGSTGIRSSSGVAPAIGAIENGNGYRFEGNISNTAIWDSVQNIDDIYNSGTPATSYSGTPTAWWKLDDTATFSTNWTVPDASGNGNNGTSSGMTEQSLVNNNVSTLNGESSGMTSGNLVLSDLTRNLPYENYSLSFDSGSSETINCGNIAALNSATAATFSMWVKLNSTGIEGLFSQWGSGTDRQIYAWIWLAGGRIDIYVIGNLAFRVSGNAIINALSTGEWFNLVITYDGTQAVTADRVKAYINNQELTGSNGQSPTALNNSTTDFIIGNYAGGAYFEGGMNNFSIFDQTLTSTEISKLYANGLPQDLTNFTPQPTHWWTLGKESFWDGSDWIVRDMISSNDGTSSNMAVSDLVGDAPRSEANGTGTNMDIPTNLIGNAGFSDKNAYSINMSPSARVTDTP